MNFLYIFTISILIISFFKDQKKTKKALNIGVKKLWKITPTFILILIMVSIVLYLVPESMIINYLGNNHRFFGISMALFLGSITIMPGPIVYPLCKILLTKGVSYGIIAAFSTSLMMVGVLTFSMEKSFFGTKFTLIRNLASLVIAIIVSILISFSYEILI
jgi:uncharacterized membrane protein YraQ (UPF0718 family)